MLPDHQFPIYWKAPFHNKPKRWHKVAFDREMERDEKIHMEHVCSHDNRHHGRSLHVIKDSTVDFAPARTNLTQVCCFFMWREYFNKLNIKNFFSLKYRIWSGRTPRHQGFHCRLSAVGSTIEIPLSFRVFFESF